MFDWEEMLVSQLTQLLNDIYLEVARKVEWSWKEGTMIEYIIKVKYNRLLNPTGGEHKWMLEKFWKIKALP